MPNPTTDTNIDYFRMIKQMMGKKDIWIMILISDKIEFKARSIN
jgi:hypothetical protein